MSLSEQLTPIFIHSLYRSGSTYLFNVFRRSEKGYYCYQEPENEALLHLNNDTDRILGFGSEIAQNLRHPALERPYFWEFIQIKDQLAGLFRKSFSYDDFFVDEHSGLPEDQARYFGELITQAKKRPVLQFCRSAGRIGALKNYFGGTHIHLWREPRNQWWSFKINDYFDAAVQLIYNARKLPPVLKATRQHCGIVEFHHESIGEEFIYHQAHPLEPTLNYFAHYALWLYAYIEGINYADITLSIDSLSTDEAYRDKILQRLGNFGIDGLTFSDCAIPQATFTKDEDEFYSSIEREVINLFLLHGYHKCNLDKAIVEQQNVLKSGRNDPVNLLRDAAHTREIALRYMKQVAQAESRAFDAEVRAAKAEIRANTAETQLTDILNSKTWHLTAPLRWAIRQFRALQRWLQ